MSTIKNFKNLHGSVSVECRFKFTQTMENMEYWREKKERGVKKKEQVD
jgi:hypothetical protein